MRFPPSSEIISAAELVVAEGALAFFQFAFEKKAEGFKPFPF
jgi:hypothetical protein